MKTLNYTIKKLRYPAYNALLCRRRIYSTINFSNYHSLLFPKSSCKSKSGNSLILSSQSACYHTQQKYSSWSATTTSSSTTTTAQEAHTIKKSKESLNHCINLVQTRDKVGYLTTLLLPYSTRSSIFSIRAFNIEIASIKDNTSTNSSNNSNVMSNGIADISSSSNITLRLRFQFWREVLEQIYDNREEEVSFTNYYTENNPIIHLLQKSVNSNHLTRRFLEKMVDAREYDLDVQQFDTLQDIVDYGEETYASLFYLILECMNVRNEKADLAASHLSAALSIIQALQSTQYRIIRNEISIPKDIMHKYSLTSNSLYPQSTKSQQNLNNADTIIKSFITPQLKLAIDEMANEARYHLLSVRQMQHEIPKDGKLCLLLPGVVCMKYLNLLEKYKSDIFHPHVEIELLDWKTMLYLGRTWFTSVL